MALENYDPELNNGGIGDPIESGNEQRKQMNELKKSNIKGLLNNPNTRPKIIATAVALVFFAGLGLLSGGGSESDDQSGASIDAPKVPGKDGLTLDNQTNPEYNRLELEANKIKAKEAEEEVGVHLELPSSGVTQEDKVTEETTGPAMPPVQVAQPPQDFQVNKEAYVVQQKPTDNRINNYDAAVGEQMNALMGSWFNTKGPGTFKTVGQGNQQQDAGAFQRMTTPTAQAAQTAPIAMLDAAGNPLAAQTPANPAMKPNTIIRAGTIYYATTDFETSTDDPGEVMATIQNGPLKGAKAIGNYTRGRNSVVLSFNMLSSELLENSATISAVAVNPENGRRGMASDVDNHYFERYGALIAAAFIQGLGEAAARSNTTTSTSGLGSTSTMGELDTNKTLIVAAGKAGGAIASEVQRNVNIPQTVTLNQGTAVGFLFMQDFKFYLPPKD